MSEIGKRSLILLLTALMLMTPVLCSCAGEADGYEGIDTSSFIISVWEEPDTTDFQCTTLYYNTAYCVFDRLVSTKADHRGDLSIEPSLAESWEVSPDGRTYSFHLREGVKFSNGSELTSSDVGYTLTRLLTHPDSSNRDIAECIKGAEALEKGEADTLEGFSEISDLDFSITLEEPFEAFLACLSMPGASILDRETVEKAGGSFGMSAEYTIGTGPYILAAWKPGEGMIYTANRDCWAGPPENDGLDIRFVDDTEIVRSMFDSGRLDIMDLDDLDNAAEYYIHGDIYQDRLYQAQQVGITYIALNESLEPLDDVRVRKALWLALDRDILLQAVYGGRGSVENGIMPRGLYGFNPALEKIGCDVDEARSLLAQAGYPDGFDLTVTMRASASKSDLQTVKMAADMWKSIGVRATIAVISERDFMKLRRKGELACYEATWIADYDDPDNFFYTFFGSRANTRDRSLCYPDEETMARVRKARAITDPDRRVAEYRALEKKIIQEDAAWIPLFSRKRSYVTSERLGGFSTAWTGRFFANYGSMFIRDSQ